MPIFIDLHVKKKTAIFFLMKYSQLYLGSKYMGHSSPIQTFSFKERESNHSPLLSLSFS